MQLSLIKIKLDKALIYMNLEKKISGAWKIEVENIIQLKCDSALVCFVCRYEEK